MDNDDEIWDKLWTELAAEQYFSSEWESELEVFAPPVHEDSFSLEVGQIPELSANSKDDMAVNFNDHSQEMVAGHIAPLPPPPPNAPPDSEEYRAYLMSRLQFECAAVALFRAKRAEPELPETVNVSQLNLHKGGGRDTLIVHEDASLIPEGTDKSLNGSQLDGLQEAQTTETDNAKQRRRKLQNQESAKRSRRRKAEQRISLEACVDQLKQEKSDLVKQLNDIIHKRNEEAIHYKVLESHVATLRAQVDVLEEMVKKATAFSYLDIPPQGARPPF